MQAAALSDLLSVVGRRTKARRPSCPPSGQTDLYDGNNQAMAFLGQTIEPAFQSLDNLVSTVPKTVKARLRIVPVGYGSRPRDCDVLYAMQCS